MKKIFKPLKSVGILRGDIIISAAVCVFALLFAALFAFITSHPSFFYSSSGRDGDCMYVKIVSESGTRFCPLDEDGEYKIISGGYGLTVSVKDKKVCVTESECPDKICVKTGWISSQGALIACAPAKVTVSVVPGNGTADNASGSDTDLPKPDFIAG